jgi:flagellar basal body-associated protein FliL
MAKQHHQTRKFKSTFLLLWFFNVIFASVLLIFANTLNQSTNTSTNSNNIATAKKQQPMQSVPSFKYLILFIALLLFMNSLIMITMYLGKKPDFSHHHDSGGLVSLDFV